MSILNASRNNDIEELKKCLSNGNINEVDSENGFTALHYAAQNGNSEILQLLLEHNATIDVKDNFGNTPLFKAIFFSKGNPELVRMLINMGANLDAENNSGVSPRKLAESIADFDLPDLFQ